MEVAGTVRTIMTTVGAFIQANRVFTGMCRRIGGIVTTNISGKAIPGTMNAFTTTKLNITGTTGKKKSIGNNMEVGESRDINPIRIRPIM
jgi:hypothetical protein